MLTAYKNILRLPFNKLYEKFQQLHFASHGFGPIHMLAPESLPLFLKYLALKQPHIDGNHVCAQASSTHDYLFTLLESTALLPHAHDRIRASGAHPLRVYQYALSAET